MRWLRPIGKAAAFGLLIALVPGCEAPPPTGQTVARVDGIDVTEREVDEELVATRGSIETAGPAIRNAAIERAVQRKIFAVEAQERGLDQEGSYHFALRRARDELLAKALRRRLRQDMPAPRQEAIEREIADRPWSYRQRVRITLASAPGFGDPQEVTLDTAEVADSLGSALIAAEPGNTVRIDGYEWKVVSSTPIDMPEKEVTLFARRYLLERAVDDAMAKLVENYRQLGRVSYQEGKGAAAGTAELGQAPGRNGKNH